MQRISVRGRALLAASAAAGLLASLGCGARASSICDTICDCEQCSNAEFEDCVDQAEDMLRKAERKGCADAADAYLSCVDGHLQCTEERSELSGCDREYDELSACSDAALPFGGSCEGGQQKLAECLGLILSPAEIGDCSGTIRCNLSCYSEATCEELQSGSSPQLNGCLAGCAAMTPQPKPPPF